MAIAEVGGGTQRATNATGSVVDSLTCAYPANVTAGSLLVVTGSGWRTGAGNGYTGLVVTDTLGTSYTVVMGTMIAWASGEGRGGIAYGIAPSSGANTVTMNPSGGNGSVYVSVDEFSGVDTTTPLDVDGGSSTGTSTTPTDTITTGVDNALVIGHMIQATGGTTALGGTGYTQIFEQEATTGHPGSGAFKVAGAAGLETATWTLGTSRLWAVQTLSFKPAGAAGAARRRRMWGGEFFRS